MNDCDFCKVQKAMTQIMDIIDALPEVGEFYDKPVSDVYNACEDARLLFRHEHFEEANHD